MGRFAHPLCGVLLAFLLGVVEAGEATLNPAADADFNAAAALQNKAAYDLAADAWTAFVKKYPNEPRVARAKHFLGVCYYQDGKPEQAAATFQALLAAHPDFEQRSRSLLYLGVCQYAMAKAGKGEMYAQALATFDALLKLPGDHAADALYYRAECLYALGRKPEAVQAYNQVLTTYPKHKLAADATYALAVAQEEAGQLEAAGQTYESFLTQYPGHRLFDEVDMRAAEVLLSRGQYDAAEKRFAAALARPGFPMTDYAGYRRGVALAELGRHAEAVPLFITVAGMAKSAYAQRAAVGGGKSYYALASYAQARKLLDQATAAGGPLAMEAQHWTAMCFTKEGQPAAALAIVEKALPQAAGGPQEVALKLDQAEAVAQIPERKKEAVALYAAIAAKHPQDPLAPDALYGAAITAFDLNDAAAALGYANQFLTQFPSSPLVPDATQVAAESCLLLNKPADAEAYYARLLNKQAGQPQSEGWQIRRLATMQAQKKHAEVLAAAGPLLATLKSKDSLAEVQYLIGLSQIELKQYDAAIQSFTASLAAQPKWRQADETLLAMGTAYQFLNQFDKAQQTIQRVQAEYPESRVLDRAHYRLGQLAVHRGDFAAAATEFTLVVEKFPQSAIRASALFELGNAQILLKNGAAAEATLTALVDQYPQHELVPRAKYFRAVARHLQNKFVPAVDDLNAVIPLLAGEDKSKARYLLGLCQIELKQYAEAAATFTGVLKDDPAFPLADRVQYQLAWALKYQGQDAAADKAFQDLAEKFTSSPLSQEARYNAGEIAYDKKDHAAASKLYASVVREKKGTPIEEKAIHKLGWCYYHQDDPAKALKTFAYQRTAFPTGPLAADGAFMEAECLFKMSQWTEAQAAYAKLPALANAKYASLALLHAGQAAGQLNQWDKALELLTKAAQQFPQAEVAPETLCELGWAQQNLRKLTEAQASYQQAIDLCVKTNRAGSEVAARAQYMIGEIQFENKDYKEAIKSFFRVAYGYPHPTWQADATFEAARCFEMLQQKPQAKKMFAEVVEKYPTSKRAADAQKKLKELGG